MQTGTKLLLRSARTSFDELDEVLNLDETVVPCRHTIIIRTGECAVTINKGWCVFPCALVRSPVNVGGNTTHHVLTCNISMHCRMAYIEGLKQEHQMCYIYARANVSFVGLVTIPEHDNLLVNTLWALGIFGARKK